MRSGFDRILFGGKPECVPSHRMQDIVSGHAFETAVDIGRGISFRMPDMKSRTTRIRKHVKDIKLLFFRKIRCLEGLVPFPVILPFFLDFREIVFHNA